MKVGYGRAMACLAVSAVAVTTLPQDAYAAPVSNDSGEGIFEGTRLRLGHDPPRDRARFGLGTRRRGVQRASAHLHRFRRLRIRWEIRDDIHEAFLKLAHCTICWRRLTKHAPQPSLSKLKPRS